MVGKPQRQSFKNFTEVVPNPVWNATGDAQDVLLSQYKSVQHPIPQGGNAMRRSVQQDNFMGSLKQKIAAQKL